MKKRGTRGWREGKRGLLRREREREEVMEKEGEGLRKTTKWIFF